MVHVHPNSRNVIPGRVKFSIDLRNNTDAGVEAMADEIKALAQSLQGSTGLCIELTLVSSFPAQPFHPACVEAVSAAAAQLGYSQMPVVSGAGHDAIYTARLAKRHDFYSLQRRHQPQRNRRRQARAHRSRL